MSFRTFNNPPPAVPPKFEVPMPAEYPVEPCHQVVEEPAPLVETGPEPEPMPHPTVPDTVPVGEGGFYRDSRVTFLMSSCVKNLELYKQLYNALFDMNTKMDLLMKNSVETNSGVDEMLKSRPVAKPASSSVTRSGSVTKIPVMSRKSSIVRK